MVKLLISRPIRAAVHFIRSLRKKKRPDFKRLLGVSLISYFLSTWYVIAAIVKP